MHKLHVLLTLCVVLSACGTAPSQNAARSRLGGALASSGNLDLATLSQLSWFPSENQVVACFPTGPQLFGACLPPDTVSAYCTSSLNVASPTIAVWLGTFHITAQELAGCLVDSYGEDMSSSIRIDGDTVHVSATPPELVFFVPPEGGAVALLGAGIPVESVGPARPHRLTENRTLSRLVGRVARSNRPWMAANLDVTTGLAGFQSTFLLAEFPRPENTSGVTRVTIGFENEAGATSARTQIEQRQFPDALLRILGNATLAVEQRGNELDVEISGVSLASLD